jgi:hypothetical protein
MKSMEFLRSAKRRSLVSELVYLLLNVGLAVAILIVVWVVESPLPAFALVLLSKWRVLAVRPRFWMAHVQANMVDLIVSISLVVLLYAAGHGALGRAMIVQIILTLLYVGWLLVLKPRTKRSYVVAQAGTALFVGTTALYSLAYSWPSSLVVIAMFIMGYSVARHVLSAYSDEEVTFMSLIWGFVMAQIGWLAFHWTIAYNIPFVEGVKLPQVTIIVVALGFLAERIYASYVKHDTVRSSDVLLPALLSLSILGVILLLFNGVSTGNI